MIEDYYDLGELSDEHIEMLRLADKLGREKFSPRAFQHDVDASFPTENYHDLRDHGSSSSSSPRSSADSASASPSTR